jgi:hypothetical protein
MMSNNADARGDANSSGEVPGDRTAPAQSHRDADVDEPTLSSDASHIVYNPLPASRADTAREQRALRRMTRQRNAPSWVKKIPWILFPVYGFMRLHDENYEEHYEQWEEQQRRNYDQREPQ